MRWLWALPKSVQVLLVLQILVVVLHCATAAAYLEAGEHTFFHSAVRDLVGPAALIGAIASLGLLLAGIAIEDTHLLHAQMAVSAVTSLVPMLLLRHGKGTAITAFLLQICAICIYCLPVWRSFCWRELKRYGGMHDTVQLRRALMRARAALSTDLACLGVHIAATRALPAAYSRAVSAFVEVALVEQAEHLRQAVDTYRDMSLGTPGAVVTGAMLQLGGALVVHVALPRLARHGARSVAECALVVLAVLQCWCSLMLLSGWCDFLTLIYRHQALLLSPATRPVDAMCVGMVILLVALLAGRCAVVATLVRLFSLGRRDRLRRGGSGEAQWASTVEEEGEDGHGGKRCWFYDGAPRKPPPRTLELRRGALVVLSIEDYDALSDPPLDALWGGSAAQLARAKSSLTSMRNVSQPVRTKRWDVKSLKASVKKLLKKSDAIRSSPLSPGAALRRRSSNVGKLISVKPRRKYVHLGEDGTTLRWGWHDFVELRAVHALRGTDAACEGGAPDATDGGQAAPLALQLWSGSLSTSFQITTLTFESSQLHTAWSRALRELHQIKLASSLPAPVDDEADGMPMVKARLLNTLSPSLRELMQAVFERYTSGDEDTLSLRQAALALGVLGQPVRPQIVPTLLQHLSPIVSLSMTSTVTFDDLCALLLWIKMTAVEHHLRGSQVCTPRLIALDHARARGADAGGLLRSCLPDDP